MMFVMQIIKPEGSTGTEEVERVGEEDQTHKQTKKKKQRVKKQQHKKEGP
jgi:hypothetical protein